MQLYTKSYYNPYFIEVNGKEFCLDSICVFDEIGIVAKNNNGWFGSNNNVCLREFDCECVKKLKVDFKCKTAFIIKDNGNNWSADPRYVLYLPAEVVKLADPVTIKQNDYTLLTTQKSTVYGDVQFSQFHFLNGKLCALQQEYKDICENIKNSYYPDEAKILECVDELKAKVAEYLTEKSRLASLSIEEALEEAERNEAKYK